MYTESPKFIGVITTNLTIYHFLYTCITNMFVPHIENNLYDIFKMSFDAVSFKIFYIPVFTQSEHHILKKHNRHAHLSNIIKILTNLDPIIE